MAACTITATIYMVGIEIDEYRELLRIRFALYCNGRRTSVETEVTARAEESASWHELRRHAREIADACLAGRAALVKP